MLSPSEWLSKDERKIILTKNNWRAAYEVGFTWLLIIGAFALVIYFPHPLSYIVAWLIIGGRQLACSIIMHDTSHHALFTNRALNNFVGKWLGGFPVFSDMLKYRPYHLIHHVHTGTDEDPDILLTEGYPTHWLSMTRKFFRDLTGLTGIKSQFAFLLMQLGILEYNLGKKISRIEDPNRNFIKLIQNGFKNLSGPIIANFVIWLILWSMGHPGLYWLWIISLFTSYQLFIRIRAMAEHSMVKDRTDPQANTRTTYASPLERLFFAPHFVNYHAEHHLMMTVPPYNLPKMHRMLLDNGFYEKGLLEKSYLSLIRKAII